MPPSANSGGFISFSIPLRVTLSLGDAAGPQAPQAVAATAVMPAVPAVPTTVAFPTEELTVTVDQDYSDREGYDPDFLGISIPLPAISDQMEAVTSNVSDSALKHNDPHELTYYHYSVYMNKRRRTAWFSAANVDGDSRPDIGKRPTDRWYVDTRISASDQLSQTAFEPGIDRGHLTRRLYYLCLYEVGRHSYLRVCPVDCPAHHLHLVTSFDCRVVNKRFEFGNFTLDDGQ